MIAIRRLIIGFGLALVLIVAAALTLTVLSLQAKMRVREATIQRLGQELTALQRWTSVVFPLVRGTPFFEAGGFSESSPASLERVRACLRELTVP